MKTLFVEKNQRYTKNNKLKTNLEANQRHKHLITIR